MRKILVVSLFAALFTGCHSESGKDTDTDTVKTNTADTTRAQATDAIPYRPQPGDSILLLQARKALELIRDKKFRDLGAFIHPSHGVVFTADGYIQDDDVKYSRQQIAAAWEDPTKKDFNLFADRGPMSFRDYYASYVYGRDFASAPVVEVNSIRRGPTPGMSNVMEKYPEAAVVSFYIPPPPNDPEQELNWGSLHLVFMKEGTFNYLRHVVNDHWTP